MRRAILAFVVIGLCTAVSQGQISQGQQSNGPDLVGPKFFETYSWSEASSGSSGISEFSGLGPDYNPRVWNAPDNTVFYDRPLMLRQYGFGVLASVLAGTLGFYIGNAFEGAIFGSDSKKGYLSFSGIRYDDRRGPWWGGGAGVLFGSGLTVFFMGDTEEEQGSVWWTMVGGTLTTAGAFYLAGVAGVHEDRGMLPFVPLLVLPSTGAVAGYHISRWFNDKKRREITEPKPSSAVLHPPRIGMMPGRDGMMMRVDALNLTF